MMDLFLVRHAPAQRRAATNGDAQRAVTARGRARLQRLVRALQRLRVRFDGLYHGSALRGMETANALSALVDGGCWVSSDLDDATTTALPEGMEGARVALVGHGPKLRALGTWLIQGDAGGAPLFAIGRAGVAWLTGTPGPGQMRLRALLPPRVLRPLARRR